MVRQARYALFLLCTLGYMPEPIMLRVNLLVKRSEFSTAKLRALLPLHMRPIKQVVYLHPNMITIGEILSWGGFRAYMHSALILTELRYPAMPLV